MRMNEILSLRHQNFKFMNSTILIGIVVIVVVLVVLLITYPIIAVLLSKYFCGKYSEKYIQTHKRYTSKSPFTYCIKDDFINYLVGFYKKPSPHKIIVSDKEIQFGDISFGAKRSKLIGDKGRPFCVNAQSNKYFKLKILGYREDLFDSRVKSYYFFADNSFFMGEYLLKEPVESSIKEISYILQKKYLGQQVTDSESFIIKGENKVSLLFENDGFHLTLKYFYEGNMDMNYKFDQMWTQFINVKFKKQKSQEKELMKKL